MSASHVLRLPVSESRASEYLRLFLGIVEDDIKAEEDNQSTGQD